MINCQIVFRYKITITDSITGFSHSRICIKNYGRGITVEDITSEEFRRLIKENNLEKVKPDEYDYHLGSIYSDGKFKEYVNSHPKVKENLLKTLNKIDE